MPGPRDLPDVPERPAGQDGRDAPDHRAQHDVGDTARLSPGDEHRLRALENLPPGHPSSPYLADGRRRPTEPSLRSLELPFPDEVGEPESSAEPQPAEPQREQGPADDLTTEPEQPDGQGPLEERHRSYWTQVPYFQRMWGDHEREWPKQEQPAATVDRSQDPPGSWRSDSNLLLGPEDNTSTKDAISRVHAVEPRVTADLEQVSQDSTFGGELVGLEFRCKGEDRLKEKVAERLLNEIDRTPEEVVLAIPDAIRYTIRLEQDNYVAGYRDVGQRLADIGYEMYHCKNQWENPEYKGINTRWTTPEGQRFEVQFHTAESFHAKQEVTHGAYERIRNPLTTRPEIAKLKEFQREVSSWVPVPNGAKVIPDSRKDEK